MAQTNLSKGLPILMLFVLLPSFFAVSIALQYLVSTGGLGGGAFSSNMASLTMLVVGLLVAAVLIQALRMVFADGAGFPPIWHNWVLSFAIGCLWVLAGLGMLVTSSIWPYGYFGPDVAQAQANPAGFFLVAHQLSMNVLAATVLFLVAVTALTLLARKRSLFFPRRAAYGLSYAVLLLGMGFYNTVLFLSWWAQYSD